jgi:hypothetical protein
MWDWFGGSGWWSWIVWGGIALLVWYLLSGQTTT